MNAGEGFVCDRVDYTAPFQSVGTGQDFDILFKENSFLECLTSPASGGTYSISDLTLFKSSLFNFEKKLSQQQVDDLLETPYKAFNFNQDGTTNKKVWANEISINLKDNVASIEAISDIENSG